MTRSALFVRWMLGISAAVFLLLGLAFMFLPGTMIPAVGIKADPGVARADIRAVYGGLSLAFGIVFAVCFIRKDWASGLALSALACTCLFSGRLVGILLDPARDILTLGLFALEVVGAVLSGVAWVFARRAPEVPAVQPAAPQISTATSGVPQA